MESYRKLNLTLQQQLAHLYSFTPTSSIVSNPMLPKNISKPTDSPKMQSQLMELGNPMKPTKDGVSTNIRVNVVRRMHFNSLIS